MQTSGRWDYAALACMRWEHHRALEVGEPHFLGLQNPLLWSNSVEYSWPTLTLLFCSPVLRPRHQGILSAGSKALSTTLDRIVVIGQHFDANLSYYYGVCSSDSTQQNKESRSKTFSTRRSPPRPGCCQPGQTFKQDHAQPCKTEQSKMKRKDMPELLYARPMPLVPLKITRWPKSE